MTRLEAIIQPARLEAVQDALESAGIGDVTIWEVRSHSRHKGLTETYRGCSYSVDLLPKIKIEIIVDDRMADDAIDAILKTGSTSRLSDGKILVSRIEDVIGIPNQERGVAAL